MYYALYLLFVLSIDVLSGLLDVDFSTSEALLALRIMIYFGSFTVLGARPLTIAETLFIIILGGRARCRSILAFGFGWIFVSEKVSTILNGIRYAFLPIALIVLLVDVIIGLRCSDRHIGQIANSIRTGRFSSKSKQVNKFDSMEKIVMFDAAKEEGTKNSSYWGLEAFAVIGLLGLCFFTATNGLAWGLIRNKDIIPTLVVIETLEFVSSALFIINETQVEPILFTRILALAHQKVTTV